MHHRTRRFAAAVFAVIIVLGSAMPAAAGRESQMALEHAHPIVDLMVLRPIGLAAFGVGAALFIPVAPLALITRPHEGLPVAFNRLVVRPAKYVWADPLGTH